MADSFPSIGSPQRAGNSRNKVSLKPGRSLMDWIRLGNSGKDLQGFSGKFHKVSTEELAEHNSTDDVWICLRGLIRYLISLLILFDKKLMAVVIIFVNILCMQDYGA
jgi:cytochrome b involved in lipid metabolism